MNAQDKKIIGKLYEPYVAEKKYIINLNKDSQRLKASTRRFVRLNHSLDRRSKQIDDMSKRVFLYSNPDINLDALSQQTYERVVKNVINIQNNFKMSQPIRAFTTK